jgi:hypothetical protein
MLLVFSGVFKHCLPKYVLIVSQNIISYTSLFRQEGLNSLHSCLLRKQFSAHFVVNQKYLKSAVAVYSQSLISVHFVVNGMQLGQYIPNP